MQENQNETSKMSIEPTLGSKRIRVDFNPGNQDVVHNLKEASAHLIDRIEKLRGDEASVISGEKARLISLAQTAIEEGAMWAVKAATM